VDDFQVLSGSVGYAC